MENNQDFKNADAILKMNEVTKTEELWRKAKEGDSKVAFWIAAILGVALIIFELTAIGVVILIAAYARRTDVRLNAIVELLAKNK